MTITAPPPPSAAATRPLKVRLASWLLLLVATFLGFVLPWYLTTLRPVVAVPVMVLASPVPILVALRLIRTKPAAVFGTFAFLFILPIIFVLLPMECDRVKEIMRWERVDHGIRRVAFACRMYANRDDRQFPPDLLTLLTTDLDAGITSRSPGPSTQEEAASILLPRGTSYEAFLKSDHAARVRALEQDPVFDYFGWGMAHDAPEGRDVIILASREHVTNPRGSESGEDVDAKRIAYANGQTGWIKRADWDVAWRKSQAARAAQFK